MARLIPGNHLPISEGNHLSFEFVKVFIKELKKDGVVAFFRTVKVEA